MYVLVDFDNLSPLMRSGQLLKVVDAILDASKPFLPATVRVFTRLYGGWYEEKILTHLAQRIVADAAGSFPTVINVATNPYPTRVRVQVELAYSLLAEPNRNLLHTYREKGPPRGLRSNAPVAVGCANTACALSGIEKFVKRGKCPTQGCAIKIEDILYRAEQKLVDSMLTADLVFLAARGDGEPIVVVSSDDDVWPGVRTATQLGATIIHIRTKSVSSPVDYHSDLSTGYHTAKL